MAQQIIIVKSQAFTPEDDMNKRIAPLLKEGFRVVAASTALSAVLGRSGVDVYYVTTVLLEKP